MLTATVLTLVAAVVQPSQPPNPRALVDSAVTALQRSAVLRDVRAYRLTGVQHNYVLGNAVRADGPFFPVYSQFAELRDVTSSSFRRTNRGVGATSLGAEVVTVMVDSVVANRVNGRETGSSRSAYEDAIDRIDAAPARALLLASASPGLRHAGTTSRFGLTYDVVSFPWRNGRMRIELNRESRLPDAVEIVRPYPDNFRWAAFGDVTMRTEYGRWSISPSGAWWPMHERVLMNGEMLRDASISTVAFDSTAVPAESLTVSDSARVQYAANSQLNFSTFRFGARGQPTALRPGIVRVPDQWAMTLVKQPDGVVIFEAHISGQYLRDVIDEAKRRWPGAPVKAIVMTSDPWAHIGGVREAVALGIPIYVQARSVPFLTKVAKAPHTIAPDLLARQPKAPKLVPVSRKTVIGTGENRIELYPVGGPYAERMLMAYFPEHKLLYGADLVFPNRGPTGQPTKGYFETSLVDLRSAVDREKLAVDTLFCVQNFQPIAWADFVAR
jgi:glyoxylase-like metal-dependent hydrolase (beta-lactamase superfamily II)